MYRITRYIALALAFAIFLPSIPAGETGESTAVEESEVPQRIVQAGGSAFIVESALYLFPEAVDRVLALVDGNQSRGFFVGDIDPNISGKTILPRRVNTEAILAESPEIVVMKNFMKAQIGEPLERVGVETLYLDLESPEAWNKDLDTLGMLFGNPNRAAELQDIFSRRIATVQKAVEDVGQEDRPRTLLIYWSVREGETTVNLPPRGWIQTRMVEMAGGVPVWTDAELDTQWTRTSIEQVAAWDPEVIFVTAYRTPAAEAVESMQSDPVWSSMDAVSKGNVYPFPADYYSWDQPDVRWLLGLAWMAGTLHPERFDELDMEGEARLFFQEMYELDDEDFDKLIAPRLTGLD